MAIVTDQTVTIHGVQVGISKPIQTLISQGDFTYAELSKFAYVGRYDFINDACAVYDNGNNEYGQSAQLLTLDKYPILNDPSKPWDTIWYQYHGSVGRTAATYGKMILIYDFRSADAIIKNNYQDSNTACVVTELNPRLLKMKPNVTLSTIAASLGEPGTYTTYDVETTINISWFDDDSASPFRPLCVSEIDGHSYFYFPLYNNTLHARQNIAGNTDGTYAQLIDLQDSFDNTGDAFLSPWASSSPILDFCPGHDYGTTFIGAYKLNTSRADRLLILDYHGAWDFNGNLQVKASSLDAALKQCAACGLYFEVNGITYKPLSSGGIVTGYTTELDKNGEWDLINDVTGNIIPDTPSGGGGDGDEDDIDSMGFDGMSCSVGGPAKYYIMSYSDIHHLIGDFNAHAEPGTSISNNIISCYVNALDWNWSTGSEAIQIYSGGAQTVAFTSDMNYSVLTGYNARDIIGSIDVPRMTNTFYDFSPYSTYEVYVPFCGWVALPDTVAGRNIKVYFETDEATCGCKGRVFFVDGSGNGVTVAEITGSFGAPCPIQVIEGGLYKQAMLSNGLQVIGGIANGIMGGASGAGVLAVGGLSNAMQGLGNCLVAGNTNYGQTIGRAGDASGLMCAGKPYLKITYPPVDEVVNNYMFAHTVGYLCNTIGQLNSFHGFTVCANPHIHISATSSEKEEIKRLLEEGVILP